MKVGVGRLDEDSFVEISELYSGVMLKCDDGWLGICQRDGTFEINVIKKNGTGRWHRVDFANHAIGIERPAAPVDPGALMGDPAFPHG